MPEINVLDHLSKINFSRERREDVANVLAALIAEGVAEEVKGYSERSADDIAAEPADEPKRRKKSPTS